MIALFVALSLVAAGLILPGWLWAGRRRPASPWLLALPAAGVAFWMALAAAGVGAQSLSNLIEVFGVAGAAVAAAYVELLASGRGRERRPAGAALAAIVVALVALGLRLFMPVLPE